MVTAEQMTDCEWFSKSDERWGLGAGTTKNIISEITSKWDGALLRWGNKDYLVVGWSDRGTANLWVSDFPNHPALQMCEFPAVALGRCLQDGLSTEKKFIITDKKVLDAQ